MNNGVGFNKPFGGGMMSGMYSERVVELCQNVFVPLSKKVGDRYWNNGIFAYQRRPYYMCNFEDAIMEYYIPTALNEENVLQYHRIVIAIYSELDKDIIMSELPKLRTRFTSPAGYVDSETIFFVASRVSKKQVENLKKNGRKAIMRGFRHLPHKGYLTAIIVNNVPEIAFKKIIGLLLNFWQKRLKGLLEKLGEKVNNINKELLVSITDLVDISNIVIEKISSLLYNIVGSMHAVVRHLTDAFNNIMREIGFQNTLISAIRLLNNLKNDEDRERLIKSLHEIYISRRIGTNNSNKPTIRTMNPI